MITKDRDHKLVKDVCLSTILTRDQIIALGYFSSISRCNRRLRQLVDGGYLRSLPASNNAQQAVYAGPKASTIVGERISAIIHARRPTPRFIQHACAVTDIRTTLTRSDYSEWRFEQQLRQGFEWRGREYEVRPDGLAISKSRLLLVEADLGNVSLKRYCKKLVVYDIYFQSGIFSQTYGFSKLCLLTVTTDKERKKHISRLPALHISHTATTFSDLGISTFGRLI